MAAEKRSLIWIPIVLALLGWVFAYFSPLYHEWRKQPNIAAEYYEIDFVHFKATRFEITNTGKGEAKLAQCLLPRFIFPGGGEPCSTRVWDFSPYHVRYTLDDLQNRRVLSIFHLPPGETFSFSVYKGCFESIREYYELRPSISFQDLLGGVKITFEQRDIPLVENREKAKKNKPTNEKSLTPSEG
jgi:hypothetical protein